jgi:uncharacterized protein YndB with AHSA1/START domain
METIAVEIIINSNIQKVWQCWNDVESIQHWAFASDDWECPYAENDLRVGGKFVTRMSAKDGSMSFDFTGTYVEVEEHQKIKYKMDMAIDTNENGGLHRECIVIFTDVSNGTVKVQEEFTPENINSIEMQKAGWEAILNNFKKYVEGN